MFSMLIRELVWILRNCIMKCIGLISRLSIFTSQAIQQPHPLAHIFVMAGKRNF